MQAVRAREILESLHGVQSPGATASEVEEMVGGHLVQEYSAGDYAGIQAQVAALPGLVGRVRELRRRTDLGTGPKSLVRVAKDGARLGMEAGAGRLDSDLTRALADLEYLSEMQATLVASVPNAPTGTYLRLAIEGRQALGALRAWQAGLAAYDLSSFFQLMDQVDDRLRQCTHLAEQVYNAVDATGTIGVATFGYRAAALAIAQRAPGSQWDPGGMADGLGRTIVLATSRFHGISDAGERALLASVAADPTMTRNLSAEVPAAEAQVRQQLGGLVPTPRDVLRAAAGILGLPGPEAEAVLGRARELSQGVPGLDAAALVLLARSPYPVGDLPGRVRAALDAASAAGLAADPHANAASALLASSAYAVDAFVPRVAAFAALYRDTFESPAGPVLLLASQPGAPEQVAYLLREAGASITRTGFFDATGEIEYLAMLALPAAYPALYGSTAPLPDAASSYETPPPPTSFPPGAELLLFSVPFFCAVWFLPSFIQYARTHPVHYHMVATYG